jgi:hypothetical protein
MGAITAKLEAGLGKIRDTLVRLTKQITPGVDCSALEGAKISLPIKWSIAADNVLGATDVFAHDRYQAWHSVALRGTKRARDTTYSPSGSSESEVRQASAEPEAQAVSRPSTRSMTRKGDNTPQPRKNSKGSAKRVKA